jgi:hypothetical protein
MAQLTGRLLVVAFIWGDILNSDMNGKAVS